jgi:cell wall-associated NlpC family hydrolase
MVSQLLFGEHFSILEEKEEWIKLKFATDGYEGWISDKQFSPIRENTFHELNSEPSKIVSDLISIVTEVQGNSSFPLVMGSVLPKLNGNKLKLENRDYIFEGSFSDFKEKKSSSSIIKTAFLFLNSPYLWGGRTSLGIDCSGFTQMAFRLNGYQLPRDASQQAEIGDALNFVEEAKEGDLAFFDNEEGKITHVGIIMKDQQIIHASGKVRIDKFDHFGIFHSENKKYSHKLRVIKKVLSN